MVPPILVVVFLTICSSLGTAFPIAKPGCPDRCGDVSIPYPFGIGEGCYLDYQTVNFALDCNSSTDVNPLRRPSLQNSLFFVTDLTVEGQFRIWNYVGYDCYEQNKKSKGNSPWTAIYQPFIFNSTANKFTVIGCDTFAFVQGTSNLRRYTTGCMSICDEKEDVVDGFCSGIGCCQTSIPSGAWQINMSLGSFSNHSSVSSFNPCSYAFVVAEDAFKFAADNLTNLDGVESLPVVVDWVIEYKTCEEARKNSSTYACGENSMCYKQEGALGYRCMCTDGYEGNPYLPTGCQDIDECANSRLNYCAKNSMCVNTMGKFTCKCLQGYHGDGIKGGEGCIADEKSSKKKYWPIYVGVGVSTGTMAVLACSICLYFELMRRKANRLREEFFKKNGGLILQQKLTGQGGCSSYTTRVFTVEELQKATNNFDESEIIGRGGFGTVYKGELLDKTEVAVKKSKGVDQNQVEQFINEVIVLSQINDRNVVKLLGCCLETENPLLVYEFIDNGTLFENLHNRTKASKLSWSIRLRIASEVARVLSYLHSVASPPIIHRDIKSANILLDQNYTAKVSDFGISRLLSMDENQVSTVVQGTHGYLDPEYMQTGILTEKSDVYSFGIVLIELLTGKRVIAPDRPEGERFLSNHFLSSFKETKIVHILDGIIWRNENIEQLMEVAKIAKNCINVRGEDRPSMKDIEREIGVLTMIAQKSIAHAFEIDLTEEEALLGGQYSKEYQSSSDVIPTSSDLYPVDYATMEQMLPIAGGR